MAQHGLGAVSAITAGAAMLHAHLHLGKSCMCVFSSAQRPDFRQPQADGDGIAVCMDCKAWLRGLRVPPTIGKR